jgi:CelD/BcsL family acetyltransferase involved in cellulose biosynthesis
MHTAVLRTWAEVQSIEPAWNALTARMPDSSIYQEFDWHAAWWSAFGQGHELMVVACRSGDRVVGIAPMMVTMARSAWGDEHSKIRFIGCLNHASDYLSFIVDPDVPEALDALLEALEGTFGTVDRIVLSHFPSHFDTFGRTLAFFRERGSQLLLESEQAAPYRRLGQVKDDQKAANRSSLRRRYNHFRRLGTLRFHRCSGEAEILAYLDQFFAQHIARRALTAAPSQFLDDAQRLFYREMVARLLPTGWLCFDVVEFNGDPIAFHLGFQYRNRFYWYKPTFDIAYAEHSPGQVLIKFLLEEAIARGLDEFDFTVGSEPFKYRFANGVRQNMRLTVIRSPVDYWLSRSRLWLSAARQGVSAAVRVPAMGRLQG